MALNGLPLSDSKPQAADESDEDSEETYVDALTLSLRHDTSDIYVPLPGGELALAVKRSVSEEQWSTHPGLKPSQQVDQPFGPCWTSGLAAHVKFTWKDADAPSGHQCEVERPDPDYTFVVDENGASHRFVLIWNKSGGGASPYFMPIASNRSEKDSFLMRLEVVNPGDPRSQWRFLFTRKFGTKLEFETAGLLQSYQLNPGASPPKMQYYSYCRLKKATDRMGNEINFSFSGTGTLIPQTIACGSRSIAVERTGQLITAVTDPRGNRTTYRYGTVTFGGNTFQRLIEVGRPEGIRIRYGYAGATESDNTPQAPPSPGQPSPPPQYFYHYNVSAITDPLGRSHRFLYAFDHSKETYSTASGTPTWYLQPGLPRVVQRVTLPDNNFSIFSQAAAPLRIQFEADPSEPDGFRSYLTGDRVNTVTDALGKGRVYTFSQPEFIDAKEFEDLFFDTGSPRKRFFLILWTRLALKHPTNVTEVFRFNPEANMALSRIDDYSGNTTTFAHEDSWSVDDVFPWLPAALKNSPIFVTRYSDPTSQTNALGKTKTFEYLSEDPTLPGARVMTLIIDEEGRRTEYDVDSTRGLRHSEKVRTAGGSLVRQTDYEYGNGSFPSFLTKTTVQNGVSAGNDLVTTYTADAYGYKATENVGGLMPRSFDHDSNGNQTRMTDGRGLETEFVYDDANRLIQTDFEDGSSRYMGYDTAGNKIQEEDENGHMTWHTYDRLNRLLSSTRDMDDGPPLVTSNTYNALGSRLTTTDPRNNVTTFEYDDIQRLTSTTDPLNHTTSRFYGANSGSSAFDVSGFKPVRIRDPRGYDTHFTYDALYRTTEQATEYGSGTATTETDYDDVGNPVSVTDPLGHTTATEFDALNRPVRVTFADTTFTEKTYTPAGLERTLTDEMGRVTTHHYDDAGRRIRTVFPNPGGGAPEVLMDYDDAGNLVSQTDPNLHVTTFTYDDRNRKTEEELAAISRLIVTAYDFVGNVTSVTDANGNTTTTDYDAANRPVLVTAADGATTETSYDAKGNVLTVTDPLGNVTINTYDDLNRLLSTTTTPSVGDDIVVSYAYDQVGNRTRQTDGRDCIVRFTYDGLNRLLTTVHDADTALVATETNGYNDLNKVSYEDAEGRVIEYDYDVRNRLTGETVPSRPQDNRTRTYDDVGNLLSVTHAGDTWRDTAQTYDELNRVVSETSSGLTHSHTYDKAYNRLTTTYGKTGRVLTRTYDAGNRLLTQEDVLSGEPTRLTSFAYDPQGNLLVKTLTDSSTENRTFDVRNRVVELHVKEPDDITTRLLQTYEYDLAGNLTALEEIGGVGGLPTRVLTCAYDGTHRLIVEADQRGVDPAIVTNYTYDKADNRISREVFGGPDAGTTTYAIGNGGNGTGANQIASLTRPDTSVVAFTYDLTGTRISRADDTRTDAYTYDVWTRLLTLDLQTPATPGDRGLYEYSYDARTRRVSREELSIPTVLSFQGGVSIQEYPASPGTSAGSLPAPTVEYVRGPDQGGGVGGVLYSVRSGVASLAHSSARGDIIAKVDESTGAMTWQAHYEAFGRRPEEVGANEDRQRANSKDEDPTGLLNEGFRYRDLETGTFITRDPAGFMDGANLYTYVGQNPWTSFDPIGLAEESINLKDALSSGDVSMKEMHRLRLTDQETTQVFKQSGEQPRWTSEKVKSEVGFEPDGFANSYNMFTEAGRLRRANPGKTDDEIAVIESARRNQAQAKWLLWKEVGSKTDKDRFRILDALHDLASVATLPLMVPSAAGTPWVGTKLATQVGRGAPLVSVATEGQMIISNNATLSKLMNYHKQGKTVTIMVNGRPVQVQPGLPFAGFSNTRTGGWTLGDEAFSSVTELKASMLHELHRVRTSQIPLRGVDSERAAAETSAAFQFSKKSSQ